MPTGTLGFTRPDATVKPIITIKMGGPFSDIPDDTLKDYRVPMRRSAPTDYTRRNTAVVFVDGNPALVFAKSFSTDVETARNLADAWVETASDLLSASPSLTDIVFSLSVFGKAGGPRPFVSDRVGLFYLLTQVPGIGEDKDPEPISPAEADRIEAAVEAVLGDADLLYDPRDTQMMVETEPPVTAAEADTVADEIEETANQFTEDSMSVAPLRRVYLGNEAIERFVEVNF